MQRILTDRELVKLIQETRFGSIRNFRLSDGKPVINNDTDICVEYKLSGIESREEVMDIKTLINKPQVQTMFARFRQVGNGIVECLDVRDGLPFKMIVRHKAHI